VILVVAFELLDARGFLELSRTDRKELGRDRASKRPNERRSPRAFTSSA
jgi:hypothetical protein